MRLLSGSFWGLLLILIGAAYIIKSYLNFSIPMYRVIPGLIFITLGLSFIFGTFDYPRARMLLFESRSLTPTKADEYNIIFSNGVVDLSSLPLSTSNQVIKVNTIFAASTIKLSPEVPALIKGSCAFASTQYPDGAIIHFGDYTYRTPNYNLDQPHLIIEVNTVFGSQKIVP